MTTPSPYLRHTFATQLIRDGKELILVTVGCLPASVLLALTPLMRRLEVAALSELLHVEVPKRADRVYLVVLTSLRLYVGGTLSAGILALTSGLVSLPELARAGLGEPAEVLLIAATVLTVMVAA